MALWDKVCFFKSFMFSVYVDGVEWLVGPRGQSPTLVETINRGRHQSASLSLPLSVSICEERIRGDRARTRESEAC